MSKFNHKDYLAALTTKPGVYHMLDSHAAVIYVGKANNLKKRVSSYFSRQHDSPKTRAMVKQIDNIEVTVTHTEGEALLLESNLIKELKPRYNILFKDDKSYPYLYLSSDQDYPRLSYYRGARTGKGRYFGPYPSAGPARRTLNLTQKLFQIRQCDDSFFRNRSRPCLQYQIKRCTAPCVGYIDKHEYLRDIEHAVMFLQGQDEQVIKALTEPMQQAADALQFERAAQYRDQIANLRRLQESQHITAPKGEIDIIVCSLAADMACVQIFYIRGGRNLGNKTFFPKHAGSEPAENVISAFLAQYYLLARTERQVPPEIFVSHKPDDAEILQQSLSQQAGKRITICHRLRGERAKWMQMSRENAQIALQQQIAMKQKLTDRFQALQQVLACEDSIERIECFDISHIQGEATVASCIVFANEGPIKSDYRRFNIDDITPGDDYAAMRQVIERRYTRVQKEAGNLPDLILIDGGKGQVNAASEVMQELQLGDIMMMGVAKGPARRAGMETLILCNSRREFKLAPASSALHLIQQIRDEAHRFAITGHRQRRKKRRTQSPLERIDGIGSKRRQRLIRHFGGMQGIVRAAIEDLAKVPGINKNLASKIYHSLHEN